MRRAEIVVAAILGLFSLYLMWKSGENTSWDQSLGRFANIGFVEGEGPASGWWPFWLSVIMFLSSIWIGINWWDRNPVNGEFRTNESAYRASYARTQSRCTLHFHLCK